MSTKRSDMPAGVQTGRPALVSPGSFIGPALHTWVCQWTLALKAAGKAANTVASYERDIWYALNGLAWCKDRRLDLGDLSQIAQSDQDSLVAYWRNEKVVTSTILRRLAAFRGFARFLQKNGTDCRGILSTTLPSAERTNTPVACNQNIIDRLIELKEPGRGDDWIELRDFALVFLQSETDLTTGELVGLDVSDRPTRHRPVITVRSGRLANRDLTVSDACLKAIDRYIDARQDAPFPEDPLFIGDRGEIEGI